MSSGYVILSKVVLSPLPSCFNLNDQIFFFLINHNYHSLSVTLGSTATSMTLGKLLTLSVPHFPHLKMRIIVGPTLTGLL